MLVKTDDTLAKNIHVGDLLKGVAQPEDHLTFGENDQKVEEECEGRIHTNKSLPEGDPVDRNPPQLAKPLPTTPLNLLKDSYVACKTIGSACSSLVGEYFYIDQHGKYPRAAGGYYGFHNLKIILGRNPPKEEMTSFIQLNANDETIEGRHAILNALALFPRHDIDAFCEFMNCILRVFKKNVLPFHTLSIIRSFLDSPQELYIEDLGSKVGTLISLKEEKPLAEREIYSLANVAEMTVEHIITGVSGEEIEEIKRVGESFPSFETKKEIIILSSERFKEKGGDCNEYVVFWCSGVTDESFLLGRSSTVDYPLMIPEISRMQCTLKYKANKREWTISDGADNKPTLNGTWITLRSDPQSGINNRARTQLRSGDVIKIGDDRLEVTLFNFRRKAAQAISRTRSHKSYSPTICSQSFCNHDKLSICLLYTSPSPRDQA
eukprot:TRINITY_DN4227_c0_g1_i1.p1 TRINITY_DN4227_c0_g1~~TRINITY_DN4227_c0_g1_i1.p1  ORF type:complete len:436 (+),score=33.21 TRINITY_DN4227_c0_g1_i1:555-1862(+)